MSGLHDDITILFSACGSSSPSPLFARFFRRGPWISSSPVAFLTWLDLFWLLLLTVVGVGLRIVCSGALFWCLVMAVPIPTTDVVSKVSFLVIVSTGTGAIFYAVQQSILF
ncbi:transmembrane protein, putative [Medicago truncatula]|uniref:Transmembrane protein, putative n=1 Tax=Medicago truncatula TaxID=3880 RepID=G7I8M6_MEDTR|nr:transmembrane protein, putative [Medicago truncatula]